MSSFLVIFTNYKKKKKKKKKGENFQNCQNAIESRPIFYLSEKSKNTEIQAIPGYNFTTHVIAHMSRKMIKSSEITATAIFCTLSNNIVLKQILWHKLKKLNDIFPPYKQNIHLIHIILFIL